MRDDDFDLFILDQGLPGNMVEVFVGYLRRKLGEDLIQKVRGVGYRLADRSPDA